MPAMYKTIAGQARPPDAAAQPMSAPQLKVRPSQAWGHQVMRFMKG